MFRFLIFSHPFAYFTFARISHLEIMHDLFFDDFDGSFYIDILTVAQIASCGDP